MAKFKVVVTAEVKRVYEVEAETDYEAMEMVNRGGVEPSHEEEDNCEATCYDEEGNVCYV